MVMRGGDDEPETAFSRGCGPGALELGEQLAEQVSEELLPGFGERGAEPLLVVEMGGATRTNSARPWLVSATSRSFRIS